MEQGRAGAFWVVDEARNLIRVWIYSMGKKVPEPALVGGPEGLVGGNPISPGGGGGDRGGTGGDRGGGDRGGGVWRSGEKEVVEESNIQ